MENSETQVGQRYDNYAGRDKPIADMGNRNISMDRMFRHLKEKHDHTDEYVKGAAFADHKLSGTDTNTKPIFIVRAKAKGKLIERVQSTAIIGDRPVVQDSNVNMLMQQKSHATEIALAQGLQGNKSDVLDCVGKSDIGSCQEKSFCRRKKYDNFKKCPSRARASTILQRHQDEELVLLISNSKCEDQGGYSSSAECQVSPSDTLSLTYVNDSFDESSLGRSLHFQKFAHSEDPSRGNSCDPSCGTPSHSPAGGRVFSRSGSAHAGSASHVQQKDQAKRRAQDICPPSRGKSLCQSVDKYLQISRSLQLAQPISLMSLENSASMRLQPSHSLTVLTSHGPKRTSGADRYLGLAEDIYCNSSRRGMFHCSGHSSTQYQTFKSDESTKTSAGKSNVLQPRTSAKQSKQQAPVVAKSKIDHDHFNRGKKIPDVVLESPNVIFHRGLTVGPVRSPENRGIKEDSLSTLVHANFDNKNLVNIRHWRNMVRGEKSRNMHSLMNVLPVQNEPGSESEAYTSLSINRAKKALHALKHLHEFKRIGDLGSEGNMSPGKSSLKRVRQVVDQLKRAREQTAAESHGLGGHVLKGSQRQTTSPHCQDVPVDVVQFRPDSKTKMPSDIQCVQLNSRTSEVFMGRRSIRNSLVANQGVADNRRNETEKSLHCNFSSPPSASPLQNSQYRINSRSPNSECKNSPNQWSHKKRHQDAGYPADHCRAVHRLGHPHDSVPKDDVHSANPSSRFRSAAKRSYKRYAQPNVEGDTHLEGIDSSSGLQQQGLYSIDIQQRGVGIDSAASSHFNFSTSEFQQGASVASDNCTHPSEILQRDGYEGRPSSLNGYPHCSSSDPPWRSTWGEQHGAILQAGDISQVKPPDAEILSSLKNARCPRENTGSFEQYRYPPHHSQAHGVKWHGGDFQRAWRSQCTPSKEQFPNPPYTGSCGSPARCTNNTSGDPGMERVGKFGLSSPPPHQMVVSPNCNCRSQQNVNDGIHKPCLPMNHGNRRRRYHEYHVKLPRELVSSSLIKNYLNPFGRKRKGKWRKCMEQHNPYVACSPASAGSHSSSTVDGDGRIKFEETPNPCVAQSKLIVPKRGKQWQKMYHKLKECERTLDVCRTSMLHQKTILAMSKRALKNSKLPPKNIRFLPVHGNEYAAISAQSPDVVLHDYLSSGDTSSEELKNIEEDVAEGYLAELTLVLSERAKQLRELRRINDELSQQDEYFEGPISVGDIPSTAGENDSEDITLLTGNEELDALVRNVKYLSSGIARYDLPKALKFTSQPAVEQCGERGSKPIAMESENDQQVEDQRASLLENS